MSLRARLGASAAASWRILDLYGTIRVARRSNRSDRRLLIIVDAFSSSIFSRGIARRAAGIGNNAQARPFFLARLIDDDVHREFIPSRCPPKSDRTQRDLLRGVGQGFLLVRRLQFLRAGVVGPSACVMPVTRAGCLAKNTRHSQHSH